MKGTPDFLLICLVLAFYSCKKEKDNKLHPDSVTGIVLHAVSKQPLTGETVKLFTALSWIGTIINRTVSIPIQASSTTDYQLYY